MAGNDIEIALYDPKTGEVITLSGLEMIVRGTPEFIDALANGDSEAASRTVSTYGKKVGDLF
jgi:hypothetical protein